MINKACIALLAIAGCAAAIPVDTFTVKGADSAVSYLARPATKDAIKSAVGGLAKRVSADAQVVLYVSG
ncbi:MAG: hypothetical protein AAB214_02240, partial [Fibrobacterota bacterium]